jgi:hypothetical protein
MILHPQVVYLVGFFGVNPLFVQVFNNTRNDFIYINFLLLIIYIIMNIYDINIVLFVLSCIVYIILRASIGDLFMFTRIDVYYIVCINILSLLLIRYTNINKYYILLFQSSSFLVTPILNHMYGYWDRSTYPNHTFKIEP